MDKCCVPDLGCGWQEKTAEGKHCRAKGFWQVLASARLRLPGSRSLTARAGFWLQSFQAGSYSRLPQISEKYVLARLAF